MNPVKTNQVNKKQVNKNQMFINEASKIQSDRLRQDLSGGEQNQDNRGMTLVEMIVTFALIGIFMVAATMILTSAVLLESEISTTMYAQEVGETILDKITGEIALAQPSLSQKAVIIGDASKAGADTGNGISFYDKDGRSAYVIIRNGMLEFHYRPYTSTTEDGLVQAVEETTWAFNSKAYMGYRITNISFENLEDTNVIEVTLELTNLKSGFVFSTSKAIACYNFDSEAEIGKICQGEIVKYI